MVIDTSAILAILRREPERREFLEIIEQGQLARSAFSRFGKGRHRASLDYGDCFSYAAAMVLGEPLLAKGDDFIHTDVRLPGRAT